MKRRNPYGAVAIMCVGFLFLAPGLSAQESTNRPHIGAPQDWSQRHIIFSRDALLQHPDVIYKEPRVLHQAIQRWQGRYSTIVPGVDTKQIPTTRSSNQLDWSVLVQGRLSPNMFPSKFSFDLGAPPSCLNDYVVFGTTAIGQPTVHSNLVAFHNLYAGTGGLCGSAPTVLFSYDTTTTPGGHIVTSTVLSLDGKKIAFLESAASGPGQTATAIFHVLTWTAGQGTIATPAVPTAMTSTTLSTSPPLTQANSTTSSPWVDYRADVAYMGTDDGRIWKITGVFRGTPTLAGAPWPVQLAGGVKLLTPPVLDSTRGLLMVGGHDSGILYQINTSTGAVTATLSIGKSHNHGIKGAPIMDVTNGTTFVVSSDDGTSGVLVEADTATLAELAVARIGLASASGLSVDIYQPAFSDSYFTNPSTGLVRLCGTGAADTNPWQYAFGFNTATPPIMQTVPSFSAQLITTTATSTSTGPAHCTGWTEVFNPTIGVGGTDFFFFGLTADCTAPGNGPSDGCVVVRNSNAPFTSLPRATLA
ncbi:MAG TPA: hypothetical protein VEK84_02605, partial [Terriglobales bacterium]|nr:hypothetical protein [Terriglobales bacterium]